MNLKNYLVLILVICLITFASANIFQRQKFCGDGTLEGECSVNLPYFCSGQTLIENASVCGCPNSTEINESSCISNYQTEPKEINLEYVLDGEEKNLSFVVYKGLADYLFNLPKYISYSKGENISIEDFKIKKVYEPNQAIFLIPLVVKIQNLAKTKQDQVRIAISLVQNIPFEVSDKLVMVGNYTINYSRYPYEVLYENKGICASKSELLVFLLNELGYETVFLHYIPENHDAVGIRCPEEHGLLNTSYCFIETTGPAILTDDENTYVQGKKLNSYPEIIFGSNGTALGYMHEYKDARILKKIRKKIEETGKTNLFRYVQFSKIKERYGLK